MGAGEAWGLTCCDSSGGFLVPGAQGLAREGGLAWPLRDL